MRKKKKKKKKKKKTTSKCHLFKILYQALRAKTFNCQKKNDYHDCSVKY